MRPQDKTEKHGVRLVYSVENDKLFVMVMAVDEREDSLASKSAIAPKATSEFFAR